MGLARVVGNEDSEPSADGGDVAGDLVADGELAD
jgi:hypothetical protein